MALREFGTWLFVSAVSCAALSATSLPQTVVQRAGGYSNGLAEADWMTLVQRDIELAEFCYSAVEAGVYSAPNRPHGLRSRVGAGGIEVEPRATPAEDEGPAWKLALRTRALGRGSRDEPLALPTVHVDRNRVELRHANFTEWFVNDARGIEQGWTITALPSGPKEAPLKLELEVLGLEPRVVEGGGSALLTDGAGEIRLRYTGLRAWDAAGTELTAKLSPSVHGLMVSVDVTNALAPIAIDPVLTGPVWSAECDQAGALFGISVAGAGDVNGDGFDDLIVGAQHFDAGQTNEGRAFLFLGAAGGPLPTPAWTTESDLTGAYLGGCVAGAGDVNGDGYDDVVIGAYEFDGPTTVEGRAYVFHGSPGGLSSTADWTAESDNEISSFGWSVASAGDVNGDGFDDVIVGAPYFHNPIGDEGRAYVFHGSASGLETAPNWTVEGDQVGAVLGRCVSGAGDVNGDGFDDVIVGAYWFDADTEDEGRALVFHGSAGGLSLKADWVSDGDRANAYHAQAVAGVGDVNGDGFDDVLVGAPSFHGGEPREGRVQAFFGSPSGLSAGPRWEVESDQAEALFGGSVAVAGDVNGDGFDDVLVGAFYFDTLAANEGRAFLYLGSAEGLPRTPDWLADGSQAGELFAFSVAGAGDVDGDGQSDVVIGSPVWTGGETGEGKATLFLGRPYWDCNDNGIHDSEDIASGTSQDCNSNGIPDECDIASGTSADEDSDGVPDECVCVFQAYCLTAPNSVDPIGARIDHSGSASISANDLMLLAAPCPLNQSALFYFGPTQIQIPFGDGWRCVGGQPIHRLPIVGTGAGTASTAVDYDSAPGNQIAVGSEWNFQCWYRDPAAGGTGFNLSDALSIRFCP